MGYRWWYWMEFNMEPSLEALERYLDGVADVAAFLAEHGDRYDVALTDAEAART